MSVFKDSIVVADDKYSLGVKRLIPESLTAPYLDIHINVTSRIRYFGSFGMQPIRQKNN